MYYAYLLSLTIIAIFLCAPPVSGRYYENNNTDFTQCRVHYSRSEGSYKVFYEINELNFDSNLTVDLHFSVLALSDAHVLLSPSAQVGSEDPVYEIVLGAGGNTFCDIRRKQKSLVLNSKRIKDLLSGLDPTSFWIHFDSDGLLELGKEGEEISFLSWQDPDPLPIRYFSFSTWPGVDAKWFFDCPRDRNETAISEDIEPYLTDLERLRRDLLKGYDRYVRPVLDHNDWTWIDVVFSMEHIHLDERAGQLEVKGVINMSWVDEKLKWDPEDYGDLKSMHLFFQEAWTPQISLINAVNDGNDIMVGSGLMLVTNEGVVNWFPPINLLSWCNTRDINHWPNDEHTCNLTLACGRLRDLLEIYLEIRLYKNPNSLWTFTVGHAHTNVTDYNTDMFEFGAESINIQLKLKRNANIYTAIFYTPLIVVGVALLCTFWVSPLGSLKMLLGCFEMLVISIMKISLGLFLPVHPAQLPNIISLYSFAMYSVVASIFLSIVVINISRNKHIYNVPHAITRILTMLSIKCLLCLPNAENSDEYDKLHGQLYNKRNSVQYTWMLLATFIDRISFLVFIVFILNVLFLKY